MSTDNVVDTGRRRFLVASTSVVGAIGAGFVAVPFISSWMPSERAKNAGAPVEVDISKLEEGRLLIVEWQSKPVWILRRSKKTLADLAKNDDRLRDPDSKNAAQQPPYAQNHYRSIKPEILVLVGICTHLGCSPTYRPDIAPADLGENWLGGFFCPCHSSRFDLAGRVFQGVPAPSNLVVPPYKYLSDNVIRIGDDKGAA
ncbi:MAG: ubiquinol-cytochrome c reductase iron-sulfur subunit [Gammaproteobacteria bacterium]|nr:ubiquinol-cytochrome c reductase iron-sulfur subunit [Gammaproteobacteria bacterium]